MSCVAYRRGGAINNNTFLNGDWVLWTTTDCDDYFIAEFVWSGLIRPTDGRLDVQTYISSALLLISRPGMKLHVLLFALQLPDRKHASLL